MRVLYSPEGDVSSNSGDVNTADSSTEDVNTTDTENTNKKKKTTQAGTFSDGLNEGMNRTRKRLERLGYTLHFDDEKEFDLEATLEKGSPKKKSASDSDKADDSEYKTERERELAEKAAALQRRLDDADKDKENSAIDEAIEKDMPDGIISMKDALKLFRSEYEFKRTKGGEVRAYNASGNLIRDKYEEPVKVKALWKEFLSTRQYLIKFESRGGDDNAGNVTGNRDGNSTPSRDKAIADEKKRMAQLEEEFFPTRKT